MSAQIIQKTACTQIIDIQTPWQIPVGHHLKPVTCEALYKILSSEGDRIKDTRHNYQEESHVIEYEK